MSDLILLLLGHALGDYALQGDFMAKAKNRFAPIPGVPWYQAMGSHAVIHAGFVFLITQSPLLAAIEAIVHFITDDAKCAGKLSFNQDQAIHVACKFVYAAIILWETPR